LGQRGIYPLGKILQAGHTELFCAVLVRAPKIAQIFEPISLARMPNLPLKERDKQKKTTVVSH